MLPISQENIPWMDCRISYCLASILFQIRKDEDPRRGQTCENVYTFIRPFNIIHPELDLCSCDKWSESEHEKLLKAMNEFSSLGLKFNVILDRRAFQNLNLLGCRFEKSQPSDCVGLNAKLDVCPISANYEIPIEQWFRSIPPQECRRWSEKTLTEREWKDKQIQYLKLEVVRLQEKIAELD